MIEILPIHNPESVACNPRLNQLAKEFCEKNLGAVDFKNYQNVWVAVKGGPGEIPEVLGIACLRVVIDVPLLHTAAGAHDKSVSGKLVQRLWNSIVDQGFSGQDMLIHVASDETGKWQDFLEGIKSTPADRHIVKVHPRIEV